MKRKNLSLMRCLILAAAILPCFCSCCDETKLIVKYNSNKEAGLVESVTLDSPKGSSKTIYVSVEETGWTARVAPDCDFLSVSPNKGTESGNVTITATSDNVTGEDRTGTVYIESTALNKDGKPNLSQTIKVTQTVVRFEASLIIPAEALQHGDFVILYQPKNGEEWEKTLTANDYTTDSNNSQRIIYHLNLPVNAETGKASFWFRSRSNGYTFDYSCQYTQVQKKGSNPVIITHDDIGRVEAKKTHTDYFIAGFLWEQTDDGFTLKRGSATDFAVAKLSIYGSERVFAPDANGESFAQEVIISCNQSWTIENIPEWLKFDDTEGNEGKTVRVWPTSVNYASTDREAIVKVKSGNNVEEITIVQEHLAFEISETDIAFDFFSAGVGYAKEIDIECNASTFVISSSASDWLERETLNGNGDHKHKVKVWPNSINSSSSERSTILTITAAGVVKKINVVQAYNVPWSFCPDITLGLNRTSDEILAIFGDNGNVLEEQVGYISYNDNIMALIFSLDSNNACDNAMVQFISSVSNDQVINHCNSHYDTDVLVDLALMMYNKPSWKGWAKHNNKGEITAMITYDTEKNILIATSFNLDGKQSVKRQDASKETEKVLIQTLTKIAERLKKR